MRKRLLVTLLCMSMITLFLSAGPILTAADKQPADGFGDGNDPVDCGGPPAERDDIYKVETRVTFEEKDGISFQ